MVEITLTISPIQLAVLKSALKFEIATEGRMKISRESALSSYKRLVAEPAGIKTGRGQKGRQDALALVEELLAQIEA